MMSSETAERMVAERDQYIDEIAYLRNASSDASAEKIEMEADVESLTAERDRLREALLFYSDQDNYSESPPMDEEDGIHDCVVPVLEDDGMTARAALHATEGDPEP